MQNDPASCIAAAMQTAQDYYDAMVAGDEARLRALFDARAPIAGHYEGEYQWLDLDAFVSEAVSLIGQHGAQHCAVKSVRVDGDIATVVIRGRYAGQIFVDHLSMLEVDGRWKITAKTFYAAP